MSNPSLQSGLAGKLRWFWSAPFDLKAKKITQLITRPFSAIGGVLRQSSHIPVFPRLLFTAKALIVLPGSTRWCVPPVTTTPFLVPKELYHLSYRFFCETSMGRREIQHVLGLLRAKDILFDVGGFCGALSLCAKAAMGKDVSVFCFEALPENASRIRAVQKLNPNLPFSLIEAVISDVSGIQIAASESDMMLRLGDKTGKESGKILETSTLDLICQQQSLTPSIIKIDVDGYEIKTLLGSLKTLRTAKPRLWIEIHPAYLAEQGRKVTEIFDFLEGLGYSSQLYEDANGPFAEISFHAWFVHPDNP